ncbi:MAG: hypothetical protein ACLFVA_06830 [Dehalococcoidia bacterium]
MATGFVYHQDELAGGDGHHKPDMSRDGAPLSYETLEEPWYTWAKAAKKYARTIAGKANQEDFIQDAIIHLAEVAEKYRERGRPLTPSTPYTAARLYRSVWLKQRKRWARVIRLGKPIRERDGEDSDKTLLDTVPDTRPQDWDKWLDAAIHYENSDQKVKRAIRNVLMKGREASAHDYRLLAEFRKGWEKEPVPTQAEKLEQTVPRLVGQGLGIDRICHRLRIDRSAVQRAVQKAKQGSNTVVIREPGRGSIQVKLNREKV